MSGGCPVCQRPIGSGDEAWLVLMPTGASDEDLLVAHTRGDVGLGGGGRQVRPRRR